MNSSVIYLLAFLVLLSMLVLNFTFIFTMMKEVEAKSPVTEESDITSESPQQETSSLKEGDNVDIPEKYKEYLENKEIANKFLEDNPKFTDIIKGINEQGINIVADDISFYIEFNKEGLVEEIAVGTKKEHNTIVIHNKLDKFLQKIENAEDKEQLWNLFLDMDIPFKYYLKIPKIISSIF